MPKLIRFSLFFVSVLSVGLFWLDPVFATTKEYDFTDKYGIYEYLGNDSTNWSSEGNSVHKFANGFLDIINNTAEEQIYKNDILDTVKNYYIVLSLTDNVSTGDYGWHYGLSSTNDYTTNVTSTRYIGKSHDYFYTKFLFGHDKRNIIQLYCDGTTIQALLYNDLYPDGELLHQSTSSNCSYKYPFFQFYNEKPLENSIRVYGLYSSFPEGILTEELESVSVTGEIVVGMTAYADLLPEGATANYQWQSLDVIGGTWQDIPGATDSYYQIQSGDFRKYLRVKATGTGSYTGVVYSSATPPVQTYFDNPSLDFTVKERPESWISLPSTRATLDILTKNEIVKFSEYYITYAEDEDIDCYDSESESYFNCIKYNLDVSEYVDSLELTGTDVLMYRFQLRNKNTGDLIADTEWTFSDIETYLDENYTKDLITLPNYDCDGQVCFLDTIITMRFFKNSVFTEQLTKTLTYYEGYTPTGSINGDFSMSSFWRESGFFTLMNTIKESFLLNFFVMIFENIKDFIDSQQGSYDTTDLEDLTHFSYTVENDTIEFDIPFLDIFDGDIFKSQLFFGFTIRQFALTILYINVGFGAWKAFKRTLRLFITGNEIIE